MTDLRKAAEMALEALEDVVKWYASRDANENLMPCHNQNPEIKLSMESVEALLQALAEPEQEPVAYEVDADVINSQGQSEYRTFLAYRPDPAMTTGGRYEVTKVLEARPLYTAPPSIEAAVLAEREACALICENMERNGAWITKAEAAAAIRANRSLATTSKPNYCTPQVTPEVTPEVGLTDEERFSKDWQETVARVEAKLKEKNK